MISKFHSARKNEEGQALVLASITLLILALCVLATINIAYAANQRIQLQNTADAAAYTGASYQARALNFLAYTNRAMIVQYVGQMNLLAMMTDMQCNYCFIEPFLNILKMLVENIPYVGWILYVIITIIQGILTIFLALTQLGACFGVPVIDGYNFGTSLAQSAVVDPQIPTEQYTLPWELSTSPGEGMESFVNEYNNAHGAQYKVTSLAGALLNVREDYTGYQARWGVKGSIVTVDKTPIQTSLTTGQGGYDRLQMIEMVNAARSGWTAHGNGNFNIFLIPRTWELPGISHCPATGILGFCLGKVARTEWGAVKNGNGEATWGSQFIQTILGNVGTVTDQMFSLDRFIIQFSLFNHVLGWTLDSWTYADRSGVIADIEAIFGKGMAPHDAAITAETINLNCAWWNIPCKIEQLIFKPLNSLITAVAKGIVNYQTNDDPWWIALQILKWFPIYHFGQMPYAKFRPANATGGAGTSLGTPSAEALFNQPPIAYMVTQPKTSMPTDHNAAGSMPFLGGFGFKIGQYSSSGSTRGSSFDEGDAYGAARTRVYSAREGHYVNTINFNPGDPLPSELGWPTTIPEGFHAMSGAMAYYHRPGDWREPPNLFNPMWGAKLMPVVNFPLMAQNNGMAQLMAAKLVVH